MTWTIALREIRDHILSLRFYLGLALCMVMMTVGTMVLGEEQGRQRTELEPFLDPGAYRQATEWANPNWLMNGSLFLSRPLPALRSVVYGLENLSFLAQVKSANYVLYLREPLVGNPLPELFGNFDALFAVGVVLSLLALAFSYDALAGEREAGTLRLLLVYPVSRGQVLMGKWLGASLSLAALFIPCFLAAALIAASDPRVAFAAGDLWALAGILGGCLLYIGAFVALGLLVSAHSRGAGPALARALLVWAVAVWIVPSFAPYAASGIAGGDPPLLVEANINRLRFEGEREGWAEVSRFIRARGWGEREEARWNLEWGTWSDAVPRLLGVLESAEERDALTAFSTQVMRAQLAGTEAEAARLQAEHMRDRRRAVRLGQVLSCLSPLGPLTFMLTDLAGTGVDGEFRFRAGVERFKGDMVEYLDRQLADRSLWDQVDAQGFPHFNYQRRAQEASVATLTYPLILLIYGVGAFMAAYLRFVRDEV